MINDPNYEEYKRQVGYRWGIGTPPETDREYVFYDDDLGKVTLKEKDMLSVSTEPFFVGRRAYQQITVTMKDGKVYKRGR